MVRADVRSKVARAKKIVDRLGIALVYPLPGKKKTKKKNDPPSLWSELYPGVEMGWRWDEDADPRVAEVWHLREELARSGEVAYTKWFRGRATFFALPVFHALLGALAAAGDLFAGLPDEALTILDALRERSPQSTKELKASTGLRGREHERAFGRAMKALWARLLVVGVGEVDDGAFPSLAVAATEMMFEDLFRSRTRVPEERRRLLAEALPDGSAFDREFGRSFRAVYDAEKARTGKRARGRAVVRGSDHEEREEGPGLSMRDDAMLGGHEEGSPAPAVRRARRARRARRVP